MKKSDQPKVKQRKNLISDVNCSNSESYRKFIKETGRKDITYEMFSKIPALVHEKIVERIFTQSYFIKIPDLGILKMIKVKPYGKRSSTMDWAYYNKTGEVVPKRNTHTNGYVFKVHLYTYIKKYPLLSCFDFHFHRRHRRNLAQLIFSNKVK
jgi:hypothetical protein